MPKGTNKSSVANTSARRKKNGRGSLRSAERRSEPPLHLTNKVHATAGRIEPPHSTIVANVTEFTLDDDWVRRTPQVLLILPPPPQFADPTPAPYQPTLAPSATPACPPSRSRTAAPETPPAAPLAPEEPRPSPARRTDTSSYAAAAATPPHTTPHTSISEALPPLQQSTPPAIIVKRLPNWTGHFRTIAAALGHAPNARAHLKGVKFEPKSTEEFRIVLRVLEEAAAVDSAVDFKRPERSLEERRGLTSVSQPTQHTTTPTHISTLPGATQPPAEAAPTEDAPPMTAPAVTTASEVPRAGAPTDTPAPCGRRRRRQRAPRSSRPPVELPIRRVLLPTPKPPPQALDTMVRTIVEALITGIAAYLHEQGGMPVLWPTIPQGHMPSKWQARAGASPAQKQSPGK